MTDQELLKKIEEKLKELKPKVHCHGCGKLKVYDYEGERKCSAMIELEWGDYWENHMKDDLEEGSSEELTMWKYLNELIK